MKKWLKRIGVGLKVALGIAVDLQAAGVIRIKELGGIATIVDAIERRVAEARKDK